MRSVRACRTGTVAAVIAWKLAALALLPAALCCQAMMAAEETTAHACCEGGEHGAMCPMKRAARADAKDTVPDAPRMIGCNSLDDALVGLVGLTGFTPDAFELTSHLSGSERIADVRYASASLAGGPAPPPPRA